MTASPQPPSPVSPGPVPPNPAPPGPVPPDPLLAARLSRQRWGWTLLWCLIIFGSGAAAGWGVGRLLGRLHPPPPFRPEPPVEEIVRRMTHDLALSPAQIQQITDVYRERWAALQAIRRDMTPKFEAEYDKLQAALKQILTPEQFTRWEPRFEETRRRMLPPPPPPPPHPPGAPGTPVTAGTPGAPPDEPPGGPPR